MLPENLAQCFPIHLWSLEGSLVNSGLYCRAPERLCGENSFLTRCDFLCRSGMGFKHYFAPGSISEHAMYVCDSETSCCILGPFCDVHDAHFSPAGKHILLQYSSCVAVWDIKTGDSESRALILPLLVMVEELPQ